MEAPRPLPGSRRRLARDLARGLGLAALIAALLGPAAAPAGAVAGPGAQLEGPAGRRAFVSGPGIEAGEEEGGNYTLRSKPGESGQRVGVRGMPLGALLESAGFELESIGFLTVRRPNGTSVYLPASDLAAGAFPDGPARVSVNGASTRFFRPVSSDPNDVNAEDDIATPAGEALTIGVRDGRILAVHASASPTSVEAGQAVQLSATASGEIEDESISFHWSFGDGGGAEGQSVSHAFGGSGTYEVRVTATGSEESEGESAPLMVVVGNPPATVQPGVAPAKQKPKKHKAGGPTGKGSQGRGGKGSGKRGGGSGAGSGSAGAGAGSGASPGGPSGRPQGAPGSSPVSAAPFPEGPQPEPAAPPPPPSEPSGRALAAKPPAAGAPALSEPEKVEGTLVADMLGSAAAAATAEGGSSSSQGSGSAAGAVGGGSASVPLIALIVLGLLAAGVLLEWRGRPARRR